MQEKFISSTEENKIVIKNVITQKNNREFYSTTIIVNHGIIEKIESLPIQSYNLKEDFYYVTPGFVNSHLHPNQLFDRGMLDGLSITDLLSNMHTIHEKTYEDRYIQSLFTLMDAIRSGATSVYAVASHPEPVIESFRTLKLNGAVTCFFNDQWEGVGKPPKLIDIKKIEENFAKLNKYNQTNFKIHIGTSSILSASNNLLVLFDQIAKDYNTKVNLHISEGIESVEACIKFRGTTPVKLLQQLKVLSPRWNLIHATNIDLDEIKIIADCGVSVIHCPVSNAKTGVGIAPMVELMKHGVTTGLGTDACSNNNSNNILNEAYFAKLIHSGVCKTPDIISDNILFNWLTTEAYRILGFPQQGKIEIGEPANLLFWSLNEPSFVPLTVGNFNSKIINNAPDLKPHTVMLNGEIILTNYKFIHFIEKEINIDANTKANRILNCIEQNKLVLYHT